MAVLVGSQMSTISACESVTGWTVHNRVGVAGTLAAVQSSDEEVPPKEGTYCLSFDLDVENGGYVYAISSTNYSTKLIYVWVFCLNPSQIATVSSGGIYVIATDGTNYGYWYVGGSDNYKGGWKCFVANLARTPNANSGSNPNLSACTGIGVGFNNLAKSKAVHNMFFDFVRNCNTGEGIYISTTDTSIATFNDIATGDDGISAGVIRKDGGVYFAQGPILIGSGNSSCKFKDLTQLVVYENADVPTGHYQLKTSGTSGTSGSIMELILGQSTGGRGISGCVFKTAPSGAHGVTKPYILDFRDETVDKLQLYGTNFINSDTQYYPAISVSGWREVISCTFEACNTVQPSSCNFQYCNFIAANSGSLLFTSNNYNFTNNTFINCPVGIIISTSGYYDFNNLSFVSGVNTFDVENNSGGSIVISATDSNPSLVYNRGTGSTTSIINTVLLKVKVLDKNNAAVQNAQVAIYSGTTQLMNEDTDYLGIAQENYNYVGDTTVTVRVRKSSSTDSPKYLPINSTQLIDANGLNVTITLYEDPNNNS